MEHSNNLPKHCLSWLRSYGYSLNSDCEFSKKIIRNLKEKYPYEYYFYVDLEIKEKASKIFEGEDHTREFYRTWNKRFRHEKKKLIKALYNLEKKGIR